MSSIELQAERIIDGQVDDMINDAKGGESECCGAGTYGEYKICEACGEHC